MELEGRHAGGWSAWYPHLSLPPPAQQLQLLDDSVSLRSAACVNVCRRHGDSQETADKGKGLAGENSALYSS